MISVPIARSDIHVHLSLEDRIELFGEDHRLTVLKELTIPGQFACHETVTVIGPEGSISGVVVVGPERPQTQVEISYTNGLTLGLIPPLRYSGELADSPGCRLIGPNGSVDLKEGVIAAKRHIHMHSREAAQWGLRDGQMVKVKVPGPRSLIFEDVKLRVGDNQALEMHVDFDEGHAGWITDFQPVELIL